MFKLKHATDVWRFQGCAVEFHLQRTRATPRLWARRPSVFLGSTEIERRRNAPGAVLVVASTRMQPGRQERVRVNVHGPVVRDATLIEKSLKPPGLVCIE